MPTGATMAFSPVFVVSNSLRLRRFTRSATATTRRLRRETRPVTDHAQDAHPRHTAPDGGAAGRRHYHASRPDDGSRPWQQAQAILAAALAGNPHLGVGTI